MRRDTCSFAMLLQLAYRPSAFVNLDLFEFSIASIVLINLLLEFCEYQRLEPYNKH